MAKSPRIFLLNEQHELSPVRRGGGPPRIELKVDWARKATVLRASLAAALSSINTSVDPTTAHHHYLLARPDNELQFEGTEKGKPAIKTKEIAFAGRESRLFRRLGFELIGLAEGAAIIHISEANRPRFENELLRFEELGVKRRSDIALIAEFRPIPLSLRYSKTWFDEVSSGRRVDVVLELMPNLRGSDVDYALAAIRKYVRTLDPDAQWKRIGRDFSRRAWARVELDRRNIKPLLTAFPSIQRAHPPIFFEVAAPRPTSRRSATALVSNTSSSPHPRPVTRPPVVAVVDMGIPSDHTQLSAALPNSPSMRIIAGQYGNPSGSTGARGSHGSMVASRVAFPPQEDDPPATPPGPVCRIVDINASDPDEDVIDSKAILPMMQTAISANPDVRVFNLSCRMRGSSLSTLKDDYPLRYDEALRVTADFDNFAHRNDAIIVVAIGNAPEGAIPSHPYPSHWRDPLWHLSAPAFAANAITVGSTVGIHVSSDTVVSEPERPSPFARVGESPVPGIKPDFSAVGGNQRLDGVDSPWIGVPVLDRTGEWIRNTGSSFAAPVVAREAAFLWRRLRDLGGGEVDPYAVTVKACLALTARRRGTESGIDQLAKVSLGYGFPDVDCWFGPHPDRALLVWQGVLKANNDRARIQFPVPEQWRKTASKPLLRISWCWDPPVNPAAPEFWICRDVTLQLRPSAEDKAPTPRGTSPQRGRTPYPLRVREYTLCDPLFKNEDHHPPQDGVWTLELGYTEIAELPDPTLSSLQRVALAAELLDAGNGPGPQEALLAMPITQTMNRLSVTSPVVMHVDVR